MNSALNSYQAKWMAKEAGYPILTRYRGYKLTNGVTTLKFPAKCTMKEIYNKFIIKYLCKKV